jgi:hypothetical protein
MEQPTPIRIPLDQFLVDDENPRLPEVAHDERTAILGILANQRDKLVELAQDIIDSQTLSPIELAMVFPTEGGKYIAAEGNRRIAVLKILNDPTLIQGADPSLVKKFEALSKKSKPDGLPTTILSVIVQSEAERNRWVKLRHTGENKGRGLVAWGAKEKTRFDSRHSSDRANRMEFALKIVELVEQHGGLSPEEVRTLRMVPITTLERMVGDPVVRNALGIEKSPSGVVIRIRDHAAVINALRVLSLEIARKDIRVGAVMSKDQRGTMVSGWPDERKPGKTGEPAPPRLVTAKGLVSAVSPGTAPAPIVPPKRSFRPRSPDDRKVLIPPMTVLRISHPAIKRIFIELKKLDVEEFESAVAVLLRVFLELSVEAFLMAKHVAFFDHEKLRKKMEKVANVWRSQGVKKTEITAWMNAASSHSLFSLNVLHSYVHSGQSIPKKRDLIRTWDEMEGFFKRLWP